MRKYLVVGDEPSTSCAGGVVLCTGRQPPSWRRNTWRAVPVLFWLCRGNRRCWATRRHRSRAIPTDSNRPAACMTFGAAGRGDQRWRHILRECAASRWCARQPFPYPSGHLWQYYRSIFDENKWNEKFGESNGKIDSRVFIVNRSPALIRWFPYRLDAGVRCCWSRSGCVIAATKADTWGCVELAWSSRIRA